MDINNLIEKVLSDPKTDNKRIYDGVEAGTRKSQSMREELRGRIRRNYIELIKSSSLYEATDEFLSNGDITTADAETVELERTTELKNKALLQILQRKPDGLFEKTLRLLFREGHRELVENLAKDLYDTTDLQQEMVGIQKILQDFIMEKYSTTNDGLEELKDIVTGALDRVRNDNLHLTYTQCETLVKKLLKKCFSVEIVSKEERKGCLLVRGLKLKGASKNVKLKEERVTDSGAAFQMPSISANPSQLTVNHFHINSVNFHKNGSARKKSSKSKTTVSKENSFSHLRKVQKLKTSPAKRLTHKISRPPNKCVTRTRVPKKRSIKCGCREKAVQRVVKKEGANKGRKFYTCETKRCNFFEWADVTTPKSSPALNRRVSLSQVNGSNTPAAAASSSGLICDCKQPQPARRYKVLKESVNKGRYFYSCPLPKGHRCDFFEWADAGKEDHLPSQAEKKKRKCGICNREGHNKKTCPHNIP